MIFTFRIVYSPIRQYFLAQISHNVETREHVLRPNSITLSTARLSPRRHLALSRISPLIEIMTCQHPSHMSSKYTTDRVETIERYEGAHMNVLLSCAWKQNSI